MNEPLVPVIRIVTRGKDNLRRCAPNCMLFQQSTGCRAGFDAHLLIPDPEKCPGQGEKRLMDNKTFMNEELYDRLKDTTETPSESDGEAESTD